MIRVGVIHYWLIFISLLSSSLSLRAEETLASLQTRFLIRTWDTEQGFHDIAARSLAQSSDGYVWVGTFNGLGRLDGGGRIQVESITSDKSLPTNQFVQLHIDRENRLWVGSNAGLFRRELQGQWTIFGTDSGWPGGYPHSIAENRETGEMIFTRNSDVFRLENDQFVRMPRLDPREGAIGWARCLFDRTGALWGRTDHDLARWENGSWKIVRSTSKGDGNLIGFTAARDGGLWVAEKTTVFHLKDDATARRFQIPDKHQSYLAEMLEDSQGNVWLGHHSKGVVVFTHDGTTLSGTAKNGLSDTFVRSLLEDRDGHILVGTENGGLMQFTPRRVRVFHADMEDSNESKIASLIRDGPNRVIFATKAATFYAVENDQVTPFSLGKLPVNLKAPNCILRAKDQSIWFGTERQGVFRFQNNQWESVASAWIDNAAIHALFEDSRGWIWIGQSNGFTIHRNGKTDRFPMLSKMNSKELRVACFAEDNQGTVYLGADGVYTWKEEVLNIIDQPGRRVEQSIIALHIDREQTLWASSLRGAILSRYRDGQWFHFGNEHGLTKGLITNIQIDSDDHFWFGNWRGISRVKRSELEQIAKNQKQEAHVVFLSRYEGVRAQFSPYAMQPTSTMTEDGRIWLATTRGVASVDTQRLQLQNRRLNIHLENLSLDDQPIPLVRGVKQGISVPAGTKRYRLAFSIPSLNLPNRLRVQYFDSKSGVWVDLGTERTLAMYDLTPGKHVIKIRARNIDAKDYDESNPLTLEVRAFYWETLWFKAVISMMVVVATILLIGLGWRYKLRWRLEKLKQEETLARARTNSALLLASTRELVCFTEESGKVTYMNPAGLEMVGLGTAQLPSTYDREDLFDTSGKELFRNAWQRAQQEGNWQGEITLQRLDGKSIEVHLTVTVHKTAHGSIDFVSLVAEDLTAMKSAEREREQLESMLRQSQKMEAIGTLAGGIAHDFNNILTAIIGNAELLRLEPDLSETAQQGIDQVVGAGQRAADLVRQILTFSRRKEVQRSLLTIQPIIEESIRLLRATLPATITMKSRVEECPPILGDATQIQQIIMNLCMNSVHAMPEGGQLVVSASVQLVDIATTRRLTGLQPGEHVMLSIQDSGSGMDEMTQLRIFDPFFTTKPVGEGTGLGLAVVHGIVQNHHGAIRVLSELGHGTRFDIFFPVATESGMIRSVNSTGDVVRGRGETILVVDDDPEVLRLAERLLLRLNYQPLVFAMPEQAWHEYQLSPERFAAIITDLTMPGLSGLDLARRIRRIDSQIPILLATGYGLTLDRDPDRDRLFFRILEKPYQMYVIAKALADALSQTESRIG
jgi:PAS domain S-box-containing protein